MLIQISGKNKTAFVDTERVQYMLYQQGNIYFSFVDKEQLVLRDVSKNEIERIISLIKAAAQPNA